MLCNSRRILTKECMLLRTKKVHSKPFKITSELDLKYLCDPQNTLEIKTNIERRKSPGDIIKVLSLHDSYVKTDTSQKEGLYKELIKAAFKIPNRAHPDILGLSDEPKVVRELGPKPSFKHKPFTFEQIAGKNRLVRTDNISNFTGPRSYYLIDQLATLEEALIQYSVNSLLQKGFKLISVPDILPREVIESCGMETRSERNQVYSIIETPGKDLCLSGTAEMGIGAYLANKRLPESKLPVKLAAVSRCFRAETSKVSEEKGIYRVHQFTKVEMFGVSKPSDSEKLLEDFLQSEEESFSKLGLQLRTLDMPQEELGAQAYRKYDVEAYMPGKNMWGELSSTSNCTDYQSRRLGIRAAESGEFLHTVNGTACAVPRLIIAILETHQNPDRTVNVPQPLVPYMGMNTIGRSRVNKIEMYRAHNELE